MYKNVFSSFVRAIFWNIIYYIAFFQTYHYTEIMSRILNRLLVGIPLVLLCLFFTNAVLAAEEISYGVAQYLTIDDTDVKNGQIVTSSKQGFHISAKEYEDRIYGVVAQKPAITFIESANNDNKQQVVTSGNAYVLVNGQNGPIFKGDPITSSKVKGVGMKAKRPGVIIGTSLDNYSPKDAGTTQKINVQIDIRYYSMDVATSSIIDVFKLSMFSAANEQPPVFFKYFTAGFTIMGSILLGFYFFGRVAAKGIEALGRNPLASRMIQIGIIINVVITIATIVCGLIIAIVILRL